MAEIFGLPLYVRDGESDIQADWNFAYSKAKTRLVTIAHQDDCYHKNYGKYVQECWEQYPDTTVFTTDCGILRNSDPVNPGMVQFVKHLLRVPLRFHGLADRTWIKRLPLILGSLLFARLYAYDKRPWGNRCLTLPYKFCAGLGYHVEAGRKAGTFYL